MPANQTQRPKFYEDQYLGAADLTAAVDYGRSQQARHALGAHTWGIAIGLQLKETPQAGGAVNVHLLPGYAWDGYGRPIVVLAPYRIPEELFSAIKFNPGIDGGVNNKGRLIPVWLRYDETATRRPPRGFETCDSAGQFSRIEESFRIVIGEQPNSMDRYSGVTVGAKTVTDAKTALQTFDPAAPLVYDESIPHQTFPEAQDRARWLIPIGYVRWLPVQNQLGHFVARDDSGAGGIEKDSDRIRRFRTHYVGLVAEEIEAADGAIRLRERGKDPALAFFRPPTQQEIANSTNDLVWVEGNLRILGNAKLCAPEGNRLEIGRTSGALPWSPAVPSRPGAFVINQQSQGSAEPGADFALMRDGKKRVTLLDNDTTLSSQNGGSLKFFVNYDEPSGAQEVMTVAGTGRVGIGTITPALKLDIQGDFGRDNAGATVHLFGSRIGDIGGGILFLRSGGGVITFDGNDKVGVGTTTPNAPLDVMGDVNVQGNVFANGFNLTSDRRLKKDIGSLTEALQKLLQLRGVSFQWKEPAMGYGSGPQIGLIAQEVERVFPDWVVVAPNGYKALTFRGFEALVIESIRELHQEVEQLKQNLKKLGGNRPPRRAGKKRVPKEKEHERTD